MSAVVVDATAAEARRRLGPMAWVALEEAAVNATTDEDGTLITFVSVRSLAQGLGVGTDAAGRALHGLVAAGILCRLSQDRGKGGSFASGRYRVVLPTGLSVLEDSGLGLSEILCNGVI